MAWTLPLHISSICSFPSLPGKTEGGIGSPSFAELGVVPTAPQEPHQSVIVPIHKKGNNMLCSNYRGISLLSIPCKVYTRILDTRMRSRTESKVIEVQDGFRCRRGCVDQAFTIRQLSEKLLEKNRQMTVVCVDLEKAYDKVCSKKLWYVLDEY